MIQIELEIDIVSPTPTPCPQPSALHYLLMLAYLYFYFDYSPLIFCKYIYIISINIFQAAPTIFFCWFPIWIKMKKRRKELN